MVVYYLEKCVSFFCCLLPECVCEWLGKTLGALTWPLVPSKRRDMARKNVMTCLGVSESEAERIAKASWVRFGPMAFEVLRFPKFKGRLNERVTLEGLDEVKKILALGRGVVFDDDVADLRHLRMHAVLRRKSEAVRADHRRAVDDYTFADAAMLTHGRV